MSYSEGELLPLSALQHLLFCPRQCALIHVEQQWAENVFTVEGELFHERVHKEQRENRRELRTEFGLSLRSLRLGLTGKADVVDFYYTNSRRQKILKVIPVEYKRGKPKKGHSDEVQLCAQGICLEEMTGCTVEQGEIYYGKTRRRLEVVFSSELRERTEKSARELHTLFVHRKTPTPVYEKKCHTCSLQDLCLPKGVGKSARRYIAAQMSRFEDIV